MRVLLLGGTAEARALAARLHPGVEVVSSLAGRVPDPALPVGRVRIGGFGGADGLARHLRDQRVDAVVDATHPFAATITAHAVTACRHVGVPNVLLVRPPWPHGSAVVVDSDAEAARVVAAECFSRIFLTTGRSGSAAFAGSAAWFLIRAVTAPDPSSMPPRHELLLSRGPYRYDDELRLLRDRRIGAMVTKNSGGAMTRAKVDAADALGVTVVMIDRPALPTGVPAVASVDAAEAWVRSVRGRQSGSSAG